jgi:hypothetical protein
VIAKLPSSKLRHPALDWCSDRQTDRNTLISERHIRQTKLEAQIRCQRSLLPSHKLTLSPRWTLCPRQVMCKFKNLHFFFTVFSFVKPSPLLSSRFLWLGTSDRRKATFFDSHFSFIKLDLIHAILKLFFFVLVATFFLNAQ